MFGLSRNKAAKRNAIRSFLEGAASIINIWPAPRYEATPENPSEARRVDTEALSGDWRRVGDDIGKVLGVRRSKNGWVPIRGSEPNL